MCVIDKSVRMNYDIGVSSSQLKSIDTNADRQLDKQILNRTHSHTHSRHHKRAIILIVYSLANCPETPKLEIFSKHKNHIKRITIALEIFELFEQNMCRL